MSTSSVSSTSPTSSDPIVSIAGNGSSAAAGGSVINVSELVSELVAAAQAPQESVIASQTTAVTTEISALGTLQSALATFQSSLGALDTPGAFNSQTASSSNQDAFTATATSDATAGTYAVTVSQLATAQQLLSSAFAGGSSTAVGTGTLSLSLGGASFSVAIGSGNDTLDDIAAAINSATGNPGIDASVLQGTDGAYLVLSSSLTGAANAIQVTETDGGNGLAALTYGTGNTANYTQQSAAQDASFSISGVAATSPSNTVTDALGGVTLNLISPTTSPATLTVASDTGTIESNIEAFVSAYNTLVGTFSSLGGYDSSTGAAGPMMGNGLLENTQSQVSEALYNIVDTGSSTYNSLASIGITTNSDGTLSVNGSTLSNALSTNFGAVSALFSGTGGIASTLNTQMTAALATGGPISDESQSLTNQENALTTQSNDLTTQMTALTASLTQQYAALNTLLSSLQTTSAYLTQAFATLPTVQGVPNA
ncbi:MAG TPA: flagellar filament capping protein FliD [Steroidobacteraceae bacterium]|nr:flagellar filament capping protein FliD [Steroidobacteraceae bacterium]